MYYTKQKHYTARRLTVKRLTVRNLGQSWRMSQWIEFQILDIWKIWIDWTCPLKQKHLRPNNAGFFTKDMPKAISRGSPLKSHFLKHTVFMQICAMWFLVGVMLLCPTKRNSIIGRDLFWIPYYGCFILIWWDSILFSKLLLVSLLELTIL